MNQVKHPWGLVLSGGGAMGLSNIGVVQVIHERFGRPDCVAGSSMGAIVGALYCSEWSPEEILRLFKQTDFKQAFRLKSAILREGWEAGFLQTDLRKHLEQHLQDRTVADCDPPFVCVAAKLNQPIRWENIWREGFADAFMKAVEPTILPPHTPLVDACLASSAIPVVFPAVEIEGQKYIDLVHFGAIPVRTLREQCHPEVVIATDTVPMYDTIQGFLPRGWQEFLQHGYGSLTEDKQSADILFRPEFPAGPSRFDLVQEFFDAGKKATEKQTERIAMLLER